MSAREFTSNVTVILAVMALASLIETAAPLFIERPRLRGRYAANLALTAVVFLLNWGLTSLAATTALAVSTSSSGLIGQTGWPFAVQVAIGVLLVDFSTSYVAHRVMHASPVLWRFHRIHHSDEFVDATTTFRTHPVESVWRFLFVMIPVWALGVPAAAVAIQRVLQATNGVLQHANIRLWVPLDRVLSLVWVTPDVHKMHHSREIGETNSNYGNVLSVYDRLLRTFTSTAGLSSVAYGLHGVDARDAASLPRLLAMPFRRRAELPDRKVRIEPGRAR
jgi:sterol desaturase/sphingolipid hydroxylase (fatty acid hydroxylase superfamily)